MKKIYPNINDIIMGFAVFFDIIIIYSLRPSLEKYRNITYCPINLSMCYKIGKIAIHSLSTHCKQELLDIIKCSTCKNINFHIHDRYRNPSWWFALNIECTTRTKKKHACGSLFVVFGCSWLPIHSVMWPLLLTWINLIPAWIIRKCGMKLLIHS